MKASNLPKGFQLDLEQLPEGFSLDSIRDILDPNVFVLDDLADLSVYVLDSDGKKEVYVLDEQESLIPVGEYPKSIIVQGPKGPRGEQGLPGDKGSTGEQGEQGDAGEDAPPLEWEFCEVDHILDAGIRLRNPDGSWSKCKRIIGRDGKDGAGGGASDGATGGGGGPPPPTPIPVTASNIGPGEGWFASKVVNELQFKTLLAGSGITASSTASTIEIRAITASAGEINTASNIGPGEGWFASKSGVELQFKTLIAGSGITASSTASTIEIRSVTASVGEVNTASNIGGGTGVFASKIGVELQFKTIFVDSNLEISSTGSTVTIGASPLDARITTNSAAIAQNASVLADLDGKNLSAEGLFVSRSANNFQFKGIAGGSNIIVTPTASTLTISVSNLSSVSVLNDLADVNASPANGDFLTFNASAGVWEAGDVSSGITLAFEWRFSTNTNVGVDPGNARFRYNSSIPASVTVISFDDIDNSGFDIGTIFSQLLSGDRVYIQQKNDATKAQLFEITGSATDNTGYWTVPVTALEVGTLPDNNAVSAAVFLFTGGRTTQNVWETVSADIGSQTAGSGSATLAVVGLGGLVTTIGSSTLSISGSLLEARITTNSANITALFASVAQNASVLADLDGKNLGGSALIFVSRSANNFQFRGLTAGSNVTLTQNASDIVISASAETNDASNIGGGEGWFAAKVGTELQFKTAFVDANLGISSTGSTVTIDASPLEARVSTNETDIAQNASVLADLDGKNLGGSALIFVSRSANNFQFRGLTAGSNVTIVQNASDIVISASVAVGTGEANTASNIGGGEGIFASKIGVELQFKSLVAGSNIILSSTASTITISSVSTGAVSGLSSSTLVGADGETSGPMLFLTDTSRGNKELTVAELPFTYGTSDASKDKWIMPHDTADATEGYIMAYDGTVVWATVHTANNKSTTTNWSLFINGVESSAILTTIGAGEQTDEDTILNIDFSAGDNLRWRARDEDAEDATIAMGAKWRGT